MSAVTITRLWLNLAADPDDVRGFRLASFRPADATRGEVRTLAGGRRRLILREGSERQYVAVLRHPDADDRAWLDDHRGRLLIVRDPDGGKFIGTYLTFDRTRSRFAVGEDIELTLTDVTHSEAV